MNLWNVAVHQNSTSLCFCGKENDMVIDSVSQSLLTSIAVGTASLVLAAGSACAAPRAQADLVEFEKMTWVEVKTALAAGKTTALIYTGGTEQRGPQNANGGHNLIAHAVGRGNREKTRQCYLPARVALHSERCRIDSRYHRDHERAARCHARAHRGASGPQRFPQRDCDGRSRWRPAGGLRAGRQEARRQPKRRSSCVLL